MVEYANNPSLLDRPFRRGRGGVAAGLCIAAMSAGACTGGESGPASDRPTEVEITTNISGSSTIERHSFDYDGNRLASIEYFMNGEYNGRRDMTYHGSLLQQMTMYDANGDRATVEWAFEGGRRTREVTTIPELLTQDSRIDYASNGYVGEVTTTTSWAGGDNDTVYTRYDYAEDKLSEITVIRDDFTDTSELRYDENDRLNRYINYSGGQHQDTFEYSYDEQGRLEELHDKDNTRTALSYDEQGRVARVQRFLPGGGTLSYRYQYGEGSIDGITIAPFPSPLFDLRGASLNNPYMDHMGWGAPQDFPTPTNGGGGGSGGGGTGGGGTGGDQNTCDEQFPPQNACDECANDSCCDQLSACVGSQNCLDFYQCINDCTTEDCVNDCVSQHPQGASLAESLWQCTDSFCSVECGS